MKNINENFEKQNPDVEYLVTRHSLKPEKGVASSEKYPGITEEGAELAKERAKDLIDNIAKSEPGTIVWFGGVTNEARTRSTMQVYIDSIRENIERGNVAGMSILEREEITEQGQLGPSRSIKKLTQVIEEKPEYKVVIGVPLMVKELTSQKWFDESGKPTEYTLDLLKRSGKDEAKFIELWLQDSLEGKAKPSPEEQAKEFSEGLSRLEEFIKRFIHDRPIKIVVVGHTSELNSYLADSVSEQELQEAYKSFGGKPFEETEMAVISKTGNKLKISFRGHEYEKDIT